MTHTINHYPWPNVKVLPPTERLTDLSVVTTVYNESETVDELIQRIDSACKELEVSYEIIVVDDGSTDESLEKLKENVKKYKYLKVVELCKNFGQSGAVSAGFTISSGRWILMLDGDLQHDPNDMARLYEKTSEDYDLILTYREKRIEKISRKVVTFFANRINNFLTDWDVPDYGSAYRLFNAELLELLKDSYGRVHQSTPRLVSLSKKRIFLPITQYKRPYGKSKWSLAKFIALNLNIIASSEKFITILFGFGILGIIAGVILYIMKITGISTGVAAISAPASIALSSFVFLLISIVWREVIEAQKLARGTPPFLVKGIWASG